MQNSNSSVSVNNVLPYELLPANEDINALKFYHYMGSLTTPPYSEGIRWLVLRNFQTISTNQLNQYKEIFGSLNTTRILQPLNNRKIFKNIGNNQLIYILLPSILAVIVIIIVIVIGAILIRRAASKYHTLA